MDKIFEKNKNLLSHFQSRAKESSNFNNFSLINSQFSLINNSKSFQEEVSRDETISSVKAIDKKSLEKMNIKTYFTGNQEQKKVIEVEKQRFIPSFPSIMRRQQLQKQRDIKSSFMHN